MTYTINEVGDVRYPGDWFERTLALQERMKANPFVLPPKVRKRRGKAKGLHENCQVTQKKVTRAELNSRYGDYLAGAYTFEGMWETLFNYIFAKSEKETDSYGLKRRDLVEDAISEFMVSIRAAIVEKRFTGTKGSKFSTYLDNSWRFHCISRFKDQKIEDGMFVSATEEPDSEDVDGKVIEGRSSYDQHQLKQWNPPGASGSLLRDINDKAKEILTPDELIVHSLLMDGLSQKQTAAIVGQSRFAVGRIQEKIAASLRQALAPEAGSQ